MTDRASAKLREELKRILAADFIVNENVTSGTRTGVDELADKIMAAVKLWLD